jgi:hypothetical protein
MINLLKWLKEDWDAFRGVRDYRVVYAPLKWTKRITHDKAIMFRAIHGGEIIHDPVR